MCFTYQISHWVNQAREYSDLLETDQHTHDEQSDEIVLVIGEKFCVVPSYNMVDCVWIDADWSLVQPNWAQHVSLKKYQNWFPRNKELHTSRHDTLKSS